MAGLCTFCDNTLDGSEEHILLSAIGGRKCSRRVLCGHHNNLFGSTIDRVLTDQLALLGNLLAIRTGRNETAATIRGLQTTDGARVDLAPGGRAVQRASVQEDVPVENGKRRIRISASNPEQLSALTEQYLQRYGRPLENPTVEQRIEPLSAPIELEGEIGGEDAHRAIAKMGLLLLASELGTDPVRGEGTAALRSFITVGGDSFDHVRFDYRTPFPDVQSFASFASYSHRIAAIADPVSGVACALVELFGTYRYTVLISEAWSGPAAGLVYIVDPTTGAHDEVRIEVRSPLSVGEFHNIKSSIDDVRPRMAKLFEAIARRRSSLNIHDIAHDVVNEVLPPERIGTLMTEEDARRIAAEVTGRFMAVHYNVPYSRKLDPAAVLRAAPSSARGRNKKRKRKAR